MNLKKLEDGRSNKCAEGMVYVKEGTFEGQSVRPFCIDQREFANNREFQLVRLNASGDAVEIIDIGKDPEQLWKKYAKSPDFKGTFSYFAKPVQTLQIPKSPKESDSPSQPLVEVNGHEAKAICEAQGKRLPTPVEWAYAASGPNKLARTGKSEEPGIHYSADGTRDVCAASGHYVEWGGKKLCDVSGNIWEWTYDPTEDRFYLSGGYSGFLSNPRVLRAFNLDDYHPAIKYCDVGFRCVAIIETTK